MVGDGDHGVAGEQLRAFAARRHKGALLVLQALGAVHRDALARHQLGQRLDLALDASRQLGIDIDQAAAGMAAAEFGGGRRQPALRRLIEHDEILGRGDADHGLAQRAPFMMGPHHQTRA